MLSAALLVVGWVDAPGGGWSSGAACETLSSSDWRWRNYSALPAHSWLRVQFELMTADPLELDPHMLLVDGAAPAAALSLGETETASCSVRRASFVMLFNHSEPSAALRFGSACTELLYSRPSFAWDALWCAEMAAWRVRDVRVSTSDAFEPDWHNANATSFARSESRLVITAASSRVLPTGLESLEHLAVLPAGGGELLLSGTLPPGLRSLTLGLASDHMGVDEALDYYKRETLMSRRGFRPASLQLSGTLPASLERLSWQLDEVQTGLSGTLPSSLDWIDAAGHLDDRSGDNAGSRPLLSGTLPTSLFLSPFAQNCSSPLYRWQPDSDDRDLEARMPSTLRPHSPCAIAVMLPKLSGTLPTELGAQSPPNFELEDLTIAGTHVSGTLPDHLLMRHMPNLRVLDIRANRLHGAWPPGFTLSGKGKVSSCFNQLDELKGHPCDYPPMLCERLDPEERAPGEPVRWYRKATNDQCSRCDDFVILSDARLQFWLTIVLFVMLLMLIFLVKALNLRDMPLYVSPLMALVTFAQFVGEFRSFGNIWPPLVQWFLDVLETLLTFNLESLNTECAFGEVYFPSNYWGRQFTRLGFPLVLVHFYILVKTIRSAVMRVAILFSRPDENLWDDRPSKVTGDDGLAEKTERRLSDYFEEVQKIAKGMKSRRVVLEETDRYFKRTWKQWRLQWNEMVMMEAKERKHASNLLKEAEALLQNGYRLKEAGNFAIRQFRNAADKAPTTPAGLRLSAIALKEDFKLSNSQTDRRTVEKAFRRHGVTGVMPIIDAMSMVLILAYLTRCEISPQSQFQPVPLRFQIGELPTTTAFSSIMMAIGYPCACSHVAAIWTQQHRMENPVHKAVALFAVLVTWTVLCSVLVSLDNDTAKDLSKSLIVVLSWFGCVVLRIVLPPLRVWSRPSCQADRWFYLKLTASLLFGVVLLVWTVDLRCVFMSLAYMPCSSEDDDDLDGGVLRHDPWDGGVWFAMFLSVGVHMCLVFQRNFGDGGIVRVYFFILMFFYVPLTSTALSFFRPWLEWGELAGGSWLAGILATIMFPLLVPLLQLWALRTIQKSVITDIVTWPGKDDVTTRPAAGAEMRRAYGLLFLRFEIRLADAEIPNLYGVHGLTNWPRLGQPPWATCHLTKEGALPFYWAVFETLRKLAVVAFCALMVTEQRAISRCVFLILVFSLWQLAVSHLRPYASNHVAAKLGGRRQLNMGITADTTECASSFSACSTAGAKLLLYLAGTNVNDLEVFLSFVLVLFLACATAFIFGDCGWEGRSELQARVCTEMEGLAVFFICIGLLIGLMPPIISICHRTLMKRAIERKKDQVFLSHSQRTGGDQCKLISQHLLRWHGQRAWYDQDATLITVPGMREGVNNAERYVLLLTADVLSRPFVIFELVTALQFGKPIIFVHCEEGTGGIAARRKEGEREAAARDWTSQRKLRLPAKELEPLEKSTPGHDSLMRAIKRQLSTHDVQAALERLKSGGDSWEQIDRNLDKFTAKSIEFYIKVERTDRRLQRTNQRAANSYRRRTMAGNQHNSPLEMALQEAGTASADDVEELLELLLNLFRKPFNSLLFPGPSDTFDGDIRRMVEKLAHRQTEDAASSFSSFSSLRPDAADSASASNRFSFNSEILPEASVIGGGSLEHLERGSSGGRKSEQARGSRGPAPDVALAYSRGNALLQAKILQMLLEERNKEVGDLMLIPDDEPAPPAAPVLLVFLSKGIEQDARVHRALKSHERAMLIVVHESDARKEGAITTPTPNEAGPNPHPPPPPPSHPSLSLTLTFSLTHTPAGAYFGGAERAELEEYLNTLSRANMPSEGHGEEAESGTGTGASASTGAGAGASAGPSSPTQKSELSRARDTKLLREKIAQVTEQESIPMQRRSYFQKALINALCERMKDMRDAYYAESQSRRRSLRLERQLSRWQKLQNAHTLPKSSAAGSHRHLLDVISEAKERAKQPMDSRSARKSRKSGAHHESSGPPGPPAAAPVAAAAAGANEDFVAPEHSAQDMGSTAERAEFKQAMAATTRGTTQKKDRPGRTSRRSEGGTPGGTSSGTPDPSFSKRPALDQVEEEEQQQQGTLGAPPPAAAAPIAAPAAADSLTSLEA